MSSSKKYFWENERFMKFLEFLEKMVFAIGIPLSIYTFIDDTKKDREEHEYFVYDSMDKHYRDYEMFVARYPQLGLSDAVVADTALQKLVTPDSLFTGDEKIIARQLMYLLIGLHERAFILYSKGDNKMRKKQWQGWESDLEAWLRNKQFMGAWNNSTGSFDSDFENHVNKLAGEMKEK